MEHLLQASTLLNALHVLSFIYSQISERENPCPPEADNMVS